MYRFFFIIDLRPKSVIADGLSTQRGWAEPSAADGTAKVGDACEAGNCGR